MARIKYFDPGSGQWEYADSAYSTQNATDAVLFTAQTLTDEQKAQARANIGAASVDEVISSQNLLEGKTFGQGYWSHGDIVSALASCNAGEIYVVEPIDVTPSTQYEIELRTQYNTYNGYIIEEIGNSGTVVNRYSCYQEDITEMELVGALYVYCVDLITTADTVAIRLSYKSRAYNANSTADAIAQVVADAPNRMAMYLVAGESTDNDSRLLPVVTAEDDGKVATVKDGKWVADKAVVRASINPNIKSVNHRGYNCVAPENTLSAYRLSKKMGFDMVEADISFTSDGHAVLLHDTTVDRTSDGTGTISELTFEYVRSLDFGSWKSADYTGEQIPTFEEFIILCRNIGLHPYIELKGGTQEQVNGLVDTVAEHGMLDKVTWITANGAGVLQYVKNACPNARLGLVVNTVTESHVTDCLNLKTDTNEVFIDAAGTDLTVEIIALCKTNNVPLEVWAVGSVDGITTANGYISGFTTDVNIAGAVLYSYALGE